MSWDVRWYRDVNNFARETSPLHGVLAAYALWAGLVILAALLVIAYLIGRNSADAPRRTALAVGGGLGVIVALLLNQHVLSPAVAEKRPCHALRGVEVLLTCAPDYSFPSDHCVMAGAFTVALFAIGWRWGTAALFFSLLLAFTRVYTGVHYPQDAAAGLAFGAVVGGLVVLVTRRPLTALAVTAERGPLWRLVGARPSGARLDASD